LLAHGPLGVEQARPGLARVAVLGLLVLGPALGPEGPAPGPAAPVVVAPQAPAAEVLVELRLLGHAGRAVRAQRAVGEELAPLPVVEHLPLQPAALEARAHLPGVLRHAAAAQGLRRRLV